MIKKNIQKNALKVLCLEDSSGDAEIMREILVDAGYNLSIEIVSTEKEFISLLNTQEFDIILADYKMPGFEAPVALQLLSKISPKTPFICVSGAIGEDIAVELLKMGAVDYVLKDRMARLPFAVQRALDEAKEAKLRLQAEIDLQKSELKFHTLAEMSTVGIFQTDINGSTLYVNPQWCSISGISYDEALGHGWLKAVHNEDKEKTISGWIKATQVHSSSIAEYRFIRNDGSIAWVMGQAVPEKNSKNEVVGYIGTITDITERKRAEQALRESEERYRTLVTFSPDPLYVHVDGQITLVNPALCHMIGAKHPSELIGKMVFDIVHPDFHAKVRERWKKVFNGEPVPLVEEKFICLNGTLVDVEVNAIAIDWKGTRGVQVIARDITERKITENELRKLYSAVAQSPASILITDIKGNIEYVNPKLLEITGYQLSEVLGKNPRIFSSGEKPKSEYKILWETIISGKEWRGEFHNRKKNGELYWDSATISPIINEIGEITDYLAIKEDITEKKKIFNELMEAKVRAEELNKAKSNFMANMSHELRTPLVGILGISELMMTEFDGESKENAKNIHESGLRLLKTITEILNFSKLESEKTIARFSLINLTKILLDEIKLYKKPAEQKGIMIFESFTVEDVPIKTDERLLREIINNVLNNAVKFTLAGKITISVEKSNYDILIKIADTGIGIPEDKIVLIFEEFRQLSEGKGRSFEGSGLGLTVVNKYIRLLNGSISVESEPDLGSTFTIQLPVIQDEDKADTQNKSIMLPEKQIYKILIVDDDDINILTIRKMLEKDYYIIPVRNGAEALKEVKKQRVDIILMDINLKHGISGVETTKLIRGMEEYKKIPIVAMTAYAMPGDRKEFLESGCSHYLAKPFSKKDILKLLDDMKISNI